MSELAPSILSADFSKLAEQISLIEKADYVHMDIMDGSFVPNITFGGPVVKSLVGKTKIPFDIHLMIVNPELRLADFATPQTEYIVVHQESCLHLHRTLQQIKALGIKAGVALNPATPICMIEPVLSDVDLILVMSVNPGFGGQKFIPYALEKIKALDLLRKEKGYSYKIEIDGGVNLKNAREIKDAGCDILVAGSAVFGAENIRERVDEFQGILK